MTMTLSFIYTFFFFTLLGSKQLGRKFVYDKFVNT